MELEKILKILSAIVGVSLLVWLIAFLVNRRA